MRRLRKNTGLLKYLEHTGVLATGDQTAIAEAKKAYWRNYDKESKRKKRQQKRAFTISFIPKEMQHINRNAKAKGYEIAEYVKACVRADIENSYVIPYPYLLREIEQLLLTYLNTIKEISSRDMKGWFSSNRNYMALEESIQNIERTVVEKFKDAQPLESLIENTLQGNSYFITKLKLLIQKHNDH
jgi:hypothetical protein